MYHMYVRGYALDLQGDVWAPPSHNIASINGWQEGFHVVWLPYIKPKLNQLSLYVNSLVLGRVAMMYDAPVCI